MTIKRVDIVPKITQNTSPMMRQYIDIKSEHQDSILFFRLGDFYEMFYNDAEIASEELDITLTKRQSGDDDPAPMCGVPYHSAESYIARLVKKGYRVAICEQTEEAGPGKKLVKRDVVRIITPGTVIEDSMLETGSNNYLAVIFANKAEAGLCFVDISTGGLYLTDIKGKDCESAVINEVMRFSPKEVLFNSAAAELTELYSTVAGKLFSRIDVLDDEYSSAGARNIVLKHFEVGTLGDMGLDPTAPSSSALCAAFDFLKRAQKNAITAINKINYYRENQFMRLDSSSRANLELTSTLFSGDKKGSLLWVIDGTKTPMGKRLISNWIQFPLLSVAEIVRRQNAVAELVKNHNLREDLKESLKEIKDLERLMTRILLGTANARDLNGLADTLQKMPHIKAITGGTDSALISEISGEIDEVSDLCALIKSAINEEPPITVKEGGIIKEGYDSEVDILRNTVSGGKDIVTELESAEQKRTGVKKLKIRYNRVFGYYIEVPNSAGIEVPPEYERRQTLANCERYSTPKVKELESQILGAADKAVALEYKLFVEVRLAAAKQARRVKKTANAIAKLDALWSLSMAAYKNNYVCPGITADGRIDIKEGRHPVVELLSSEPFVPNDTTLDNKSNRCAIITGPNMAGKSTYMRQVAIITLMAQMGSFVPAKSAEISVCDAIFTRVGACDDLSTGRSTFMVEMSEVAAILKHATKDSLLIIDEIGRGTSTYDGMAIARAVLEFAADKKKIGAKTLFATHYHELTVLEDEIEGVKNYNIAAKKRGDDIIFLRRIVRGGADDSYGVEVAKLAGVPEKVISRASEILMALESGERVIIKEVERQGEAQGSLSNTLQDAIVQEMSHLDINTLTPIEALSKLGEFIDRAKSI